MDRRTFRWTEGHIDGQNDMIKNPKYCLRRKSMPPRHGFREYIGTKNQKNGYYYKDTYIIRDN